MSSHVAMGCDHTRVCDVYKAVTLSMCWRLTTALNVICRNQQYGSQPTRRSRRSSSDPRDL
eukprot:9230339-Pyramimonas_sp.AAC.1